MEGAAGLLPGRALRGVAARALMDGNVVKGLAHDSKRTALAVYVREGDKRDSDVLSPLSGRAAGWWCRHREVCTGLPRTAHRCTCTYMHTHTHTPQGYLDPQNPGSKCSVSLPTLIAQPHHHVSPPYESAWAAVQSPTDGGLGP